MIHFLQFLRYYAMGGLIFLFIMNLLYIFAKKISKDENLEFKIEPFDLKEILWTMLLWPIFLVFILFTKRKPTQKHEDYDK